MIGIFADKGQEVIVNKLTKAFEIALRHPHIDRRSQAIDNLREDYFEDKRILDPLDSSTLTAVLVKFDDVLKGLAGPLLKVALSDESDLVREAAVDLLIMAKDHRLVQGIT